MKSVLIVDDAAFMKLTIIKMLKESNYNIIAEAADGLEAVKLYKKLNPDIVTMDITMPNMNGIEALKEIIQYNSNAKVIMISALGQEPYIKEAVINGALSFLVKPFQKEKLIEALEKIAK